MEKIEKYYTKNSIQLHEKEKWRIMKVNLLEKIKFKIMLFLMGFPEGIRGKIELDKTLNFWDKFRYWVIVNFY